MKQKILVVCPTKRDRHELSLPHVVGDVKFLFPDYDETAFERILSRQHVGDFEKLSPSIVIDELLEMCDMNAITGVLSSDDYPGSIYASIIAQHKNFPAPTTASVLLCQHKYYSRYFQAQYVPEATPTFELIDPYAFDSKKFSMEFPIFLKPVKAYFSYLANKVETLDELKKIIKKSGGMPEAFLFQFNWFLKHFSGLELSSDYLIAEGLLQGIQINVEGYVQNNVCTIIGVTDSIMFPGTISFSRFEYPSALPESVQKRMAQIAQTFLTSIHFNNSLFNIEMMYNPTTNEIHIIEVNPRFSSQFSDLYEKVDGINAYTIAVDLALGREPKLVRAQGKYAVAASCVLRTFENKRVIKVPSEQQIERAKELIPDIRVYMYTKEGDLLSDELQDGKSYRYGLIHVGARDRQELNEKFEYAQKLLPFEFAVLK